MVERIGDMEYLPVNELDVVFVVEVVSDDVPLAHPDAETHDPFAMTEESLTWSSGCAERGRKWREATHELLLSETWKKKVRTINVGVQVGGHGVHVIKHAVGRADDVVDAEN